MIKTTTQRPSKAPEPSKAKSNHTTTIPAASKASPPLEPPLLYRIKSKRADSPDPVEWFMTNRSKPPVAYTSALPPKLVDSEPARRRVDMLFTEAEASVITLKIYAGGHVMAEATAVDLPLSKEALAQMPLPETYGDENATTGSSAPGTSKRRVISSPFRLHSDDRNALTYMWHGRRMTLAEIARLESGCPT
jgi:hypothetical protein